MLNKKNYNEFKTKNGRKVFDGGGVFPDVPFDASKNSTITNAILNDDLVFNFATAYYYKNKINNVNDLKLSDTDFSNFKKYLKANNFSFKTETEKALYKAFETATTEELNDNLEKDFNALISTLNKSKNDVVDENKAFLLELLTEEIVKRYAYREGLYEYYKIHDPKIKKSNRNTW